VNDLRIRRRKTVELTIEENDWAPYETLLAVHSIVQLQVPFMRGAESGLEPKKLLRRETDKFPTVQQGEARHRIAAQWH
jgi:hypothetical protein